MQINIILIYLKFVIFLQICSKLVRQRHMIRWTNRAAILHGVILSQAPAVVGVAKRYKTNHFFHHVLIIIISQTQSFGRQTQRYGIQVSDTTQRKTESSGRPTRFKSGRFSTFVFSVVLFILYVNVA